MAQTWELSYLLTDHLGSVVAVTDSSGALISQQRYLPFGGTRELPNQPTSGLTDYGYTGQRNLDEGIGLMDYKARFYSPYLNHFTQPDTIVPDPYNSQDYDRYAYARNNPLRYTDPSGHIPCSDAYDFCGKMSFDGKITTSILRRAIKSQFGVYLDDGGAEHPYFVDGKGKPTSHGRTWDITNMSTMYFGLSRIDDALGGKLKSTIGSATFTLNDHPGDGSFVGRTSGTTVDFYADSLVPLENIYHEFGHVLNSLPDRDNMFSNLITGDESFINEYGYVDRNALINKADRFVQASTNEVTEQWADIFLNYVSGNINMNTTQGQEMNNFIRNALVTNYITP